MTTLWTAQIIARAVVRSAGGGRRLVLLGKDEEGCRHWLIVVQGFSMMVRLFESSPDAFVRFLDYANCSLIRRNGVLSLEVPEGVDVEIEELPPQEELQTAWERIGGKIWEEGAGDGG